MKRKSKITESDIDQLYTVLNGLKSKAAIKDFLGDICTPGEIQAMAERLKIAQLLSEGLTYRAIAEKTGASTTTVTRVARFLEGGYGGYKKALKR